MKSGFARFLSIAALISTTSAVNAFASQPAATGLTQTNQPPPNLAVTAVNDFAFDLYQQLAKENPDKNLFFSPYSLLSALTMAAEGARGQTAEEMGKALRFPMEARLARGNATEAIWNITSIHSGMAELRKRFGGASKPVPKEISDRIAALSASLDAKQRRAATAANYAVADLFESQARQVAQELNALYKTLGDYELRIANGLWAEQTFPLKKPFFDTLNAHYGIGAVAPMDFMGQPEASRQKINAWCAQQTYSRIREPLPPGVITDQTRLVLASGIYFRGEWQRHFVAGLTQDEDFRCGAARIRAPMMRHGEPVRVGYAAFEGDGSKFATPREVAAGEHDESKLYPGANGFVVAELAYRGEQLSMVILLPRSATGLADLERKLSADKLRAWVNQLEQRKTTVVLPKFAFTTDNDMAHLLESLGMKEAFDQSHADFGGISDKRPLFLTHVLHHAALEVNEKGTVAVAATFAATAGGVPATVPFVPIFRADHPFLFLIRDRKTGTFLFFGRLANPKN